MRGKRNRIVVLLAVVTLIVTTAAFAGPVVGSPPEPPPLVALAANAPLSASGFQGIVMDRDAGTKIVGARIVFTSENGAVRKEVTSDANGSYRVDLPQGRYRVTASHADYEPYTTGNGFFVVTGTSYQVGNIIMVRKAASGTQPSQQPGCQGVQVGGFCWYFGVDSASCQTVCASHGGYDEATRTYAGSAGSAANCRQVFQALGIPLGDFYETSQGGIGCFAIQNTSGRYNQYWDKQPTTASATYGVPGRRRVCACTAKPAQAPSSSSSNAQITVNGSGHRFGPLPVIFYALTDPSGQDIYPLGQGSFALFALYDSGSTKVRINNLTPTAQNPNRVAGLNWGKSDTGHLNLSNAATVNIRLNGLNTRKADGSIPIASPGSANGAQVEVKNVAAKPENVNVTLIGAPVINQLVAYMDYRKLVSDPAIESAGTGAKGPTTSFYQPGDARIPSADLALTLEPAGSRYWLRNVAFTTSGRSISDQQAGLNLLFDTGTTLTIIGDRVANALGLQPGAGTFNCYGGTRNGYALDAVTVSAGNGFYRITDAAVCWRQASIETGDVVIGSNFFDQVAIVLDGPGNRLGIIGKTSAGQGATPSGPPNCSTKVGDVFNSFWQRQAVYSRLGCPAGAVHTGMAAEERFQHGSMLWRDSNDRVYVIYDDGTWKSYADTFTGGTDPEYPCGVQTSPPSARRGFGKVWCLQTGVRNRLGDAVEGEVGYGMAGGGPAETFQDFTGGMMYQSHRFNTIYALFSDGTWIKS
jgi:hypothetical protein